MSSDQEIIETVDGWERERMWEQKRKRDRVASCVRWTVFGFVVVWLVILIGAGFTRVEKRRQQDKQRREEAWVECVNALGAETCRLVREMPK